MEPKEGFKYVVLNSKLPEHEQYTNVETIFANGAMCAPVKFTDPETGMVRWSWIVTDFIYSSYMDGERVNPVEEANSREELVKPMED